MKNIIVSLLVLAGIEAVVIAFAGWLWGMALLFLVVGAVLMLMALLAGSGGETKEMQKFAWYSVSCIAIAICLAIWLSLKV